MASDRRWPGSAIGIWSLRRNWGPAGSPASVRGLLCACWGVCRTYQKVDGAQAPPLPRGRDRSRPLGFVVACCVRLFFVLIWAGARCPSFFWPRDGRGSRQSFRSMPNSMYSCTYVLSSGLQYGGCCPSACSRSGPGGGDGFFQREPLGRWTWGGPRRGLRQLCQCGQSFSLRARRMGGCVSLGEPGASSKGHAGRFCPDDVPGSNGRPALRWFEIGSCRTCHLVFNRRHFFRTCFTTVCASFAT